MSSDDNPVVYFAPQNGVARRVSALYNHKLNSVCWKLYQKYKKCVAFEWKKDRKLYYVYDNFLLRILFGLSWTEMEFLNSLFNRVFWA